MAANEATIPGSAEPADAAALRRKYLEERDKRLRDDGNDQYVEPVGRYAHFLEDPYVEADDREPIHDEVTVALNELRELAQGIYPSLLVERGLVEAVSSLGRRSALPARVTGELAGHVPEAQVRADHDWIKQVMANLLSNAVKFSPAGREVVVEARVLDPTSSPLGEESVEIAVIDEERRPIGLLDVQDLLDTGL